MVPFKVLTLDSYTLILPIFPVFVAFVEGFDWWYLLEQPRHGPLNICYRLKIFFGLALVVTWINI